MHNIAAFKQFLATPRSIVITTHHKPDADALGSSLGMAAFLKKKGHRVTVITPTDYPEFLFWMQGNDAVVVYEEGNEQRSAALIDAAEVVFCLDFSRLDRINELGELVRHCTAKKVLIDHHMDPEDFADFVLWDVKAAATAQLIYELIALMGDCDLIDADIANSLYAGIMTDTGGFRHSNTSKQVHLTTAALIDHGANVTMVSNAIYDNNSFNRMKFLGFALSEKLCVLPQYQVAYFAITADELARFDSKTGDTEGLVNYALSIKGVKMAALIIDRTVAVKMSFRSFGDFSVNEFARNHFNGGGHKNAAGGRSDDTLEATVARFVALLPQYQAQLTGQPGNAVTNA